MVNIIHKYNTYIQADISYLFRLNIKQYSIVSGNTHFNTPDKIISIPFNIAVYLGKPFKKNQFFRSKFSENGKNDDTIIGHGYFDLFYAEQNSKQKVVLRYVSKMRKFIYNIYINFVIIIKPAFYPISSAAQNLTVVNDSD